MSKVTDHIDEELRGWIAQQHMFFVATAPLSATGHVNVSPKGLDTLRVLDDRTLAYLDFTGSGVETIAHLRENSRVVLMMCAFDGPPRIMRFHGRGEVLPPDGSEFAALAPLFDQPEKARSIIRVDVARVSRSCGFGVPRMDFAEDRPTLDEWHDKKGVDGAHAYQRQKNAVSLDGLTGVDWLGD